MAGGSANGLKRELREGVVWLVFDRPRASNAVDAALAQAFAAALTSAGNDPAIIGAVITGAGGKVFSAGIDIKNPDALDHEALATRRRDTVAHCLDAILSFEKPLVAAINGPAIGLSCMIALLADQAIASDRAVFALPEIDIGIPTFLGASIVSRAVGMALARELVLTGRQISAADARQHHLVGSVVAHEDLERSAQDAAKMLAAKPRATFALNKRWLARDLRAEFDAANAHSKAAQAELAADKARHPH